MLNLENISFVFIETESLCYLIEISKQSAKVIFKMTETDENAIIPIMFSTH